MFHNNKKNKIVNCFYNQKHHYFTRIQGRINMIQFGVIGIGRRGVIPLMYYPKDRAKLVAVAEINPATTENFRKEHPNEDIFITDDYRKLLARPEVQAVFIMVRDPLHEEIAVAALEAGKDVFLEKPMAITLEGCDRILETACRKRRRLFLGHNMRYMPFVMKMKEIIDSGVIGEIQSVWVRHFINYGSCYFRHWCAERRNCTGLLLQKGAHDIDVIHYLTGSFTQRVTAMGRLSVYNRTTGRLAPGEAPDREISFKQECWPPLELKGLSPKMDVEDHNMILMQLENGVQASYTQCMYAPDAERNYTFIGTHGRIENIGDIDYPVELHVWTNRGRRREPDIVYRINGSEDAHGGADIRIVEAFFDFLEGKRPANPSPIAARNAVAVGIMGHQSMRDNSTPRDIPGLPEHIKAYFDAGQPR